jgi:hypothetical protein
VYRAVCPTTTSIIVIIVICGLHARHNASTAAVSARKDDSKDEQAGENDDETYRHNDSFHGHSPFFGKRCELSSQRNDYWGLA